MKPGPCCGRPRALSDEDTDASGAKDEALLEEALPGYARSFFHASTVCKRTDVIDDDPAPSDSRSERERGPCEARTRASSSLEEASSMGSFEMFSPSIEQPSPASDTVVSDKRSPAADRDSTLTTLPQREEKLAALVPSSGVVCSDLCSRTVESVRALGRGVLLIMERRCSCQSSVVTVFPLFNF